VETDEDRCCEALRRTNAFSNHGYEFIITDQGHRVRGTCEWIENDHCYEEWIRQSNQLLWICGSPGKGKTFLSIHLAELLKGQSPPHSSNEPSTPLVITFFCSHADIERSVGVFIVRSLLAQLLDADNSLYKLLVPKFKDFEARQDNLFGDNNQEEIWKLVVHMLGRFKRQVYLVLDGLDECDDSSINFLLKKLQHLYSTTLKNKLWKVGTVLVSRALQQPVDITLKIDLDQHDEDRDRKRDENLELFTRSRLQNCLFSDQSKHDLIRILISHAQGRYLWISLAIPMLRDNSKLMKSILDDPKTIETSLPQELGPIYERILGRITQSDQPQVSDILLSICLAYRPLEMSEIAAFTNIPDDQIEASLKRCENLLSFNSNTRVYRLVHLSLKEHLLRLGQRRLSKTFKQRKILLEIIDWVLKMTAFLRWSSFQRLAVLSVFVFYAVFCLFSQRHRIYIPAFILIFVAAYYTNVTSIVHPFLQVITAFDRAVWSFLQQKKAFLQSLSFGIAEGQDQQIMLEKLLRLMQSHFSPQKPEKSGTIQKSIDKEKDDTFPKSGLQYACLYWVEHIRKSGSELRDNNQVHEFLRGHLLHCFEALGWMGKVSEGVHGIAALESFATVSIFSTVHTLAEHSVSQTIAQIFRISSMTQSGLFSIIGQLLSRLQFRLTVALLYSYLLQV
jgi:NACHT domain